MSRARLVGAVALAGLLLCCKDRPTRATPERAPLAKPAAPAVSAAAAVPATSATARAPPRSAPQPDPSRHAWLESGDEQPAAVDTLVGRFRTPQGAERVDVATGSFGEWLRTLPLAAPGTAVKSFNGTPLYAPDDPRIAAVVAIDVGSADLQQCADAVIRLHAEWRWSRGGRDMSYRAAAGIDLPFQRYASGERIEAKGASIAWRTGGKPGADRASFRRYLNTVFAWANTVSLDRQAQAVDVADIRPGDFFVLPGNPGHAVMVLDLATRDSRHFALLGQSFMPAQSFQVLRPAAGQVWFELDPNQSVETPFWRPFPWSSLRRLS